MGYPNRRDEPRGVQQIGPRRPSLYDNPVNKFVAAVHRLTRDELRDRPKPAEGHLNARRATLHLTVRGSEGAEQNLGPWTADRALPAVRMLLCSTATNGQRG